MDILVICPKCCGLGSDVCPASRTNKPATTVYCTYIFFLSKPRVSDTWAWHTGALLALCETKGLRQDFSTAFKLEKQGLVKASTPDHSGCKFVHLGPPGILWASSAQRLFSNLGPKGLTRKHALPPHISGRQSCNLSKKH